MRVSAVNVDGSGSCAREYLVAPGTGYATWSTSWDRPRNVTGRARTIGRRLPVRSGIIDCFGSRGIRMRLYPGDGQVMGG